MIMMTYQLDNLPVAAWVAKFVAAFVAALLALFRIDVNMPLPPIKSTKITITSTNVTGRAIIGDLNHKSISSKATMANTIHAHPGIAPR